MNCQAGGGNGLAGDSVGAKSRHLIFLDEPTTYLDISYQLEILELLKKLNEEEGYTIVMVFARHQSSFALFRPYRGASGRQSRLSRCGG